jgi:hypothetical protein
MATTLAIIGIVLAGIALGYGWMARQELNIAARRLDRYNRALFDANEEIRSLREGQAERFAQLQAQVARLSGQAAFRPEMSMREVYALHPQAQDIMAGFHVGGCSSCAVDDVDERLEQVCRSSGLNVDEVVGNLNALFPASGQNGLPKAQPIQRVKLPNLVLE